MIQKLSQVLRISTFSSLNPLTNSIQKTCRFVLALAVLFSGFSAVGVAAHASVTSAGCGKAISKTGLYTLGSTDGAKRKRTFLIQVPSPYNEKQPYNLVFVFHGAGGNSQQAYSYGLQSASGAADSSIFVYPQGIAFENYGVGWDDANNGYDLPFFDNMVNDVESSYCIDTSRVLVAGFSWGGDFVTSLVCNRGTTIRAAEANSTVDEYKDNANYLTYVNLPCPTIKHIPVRFEHAENQDSEYPAPDFASTSKLFRYLSSCGTTTAEVAPKSSVESCVSYNGCESKFVECQFSENLGHVLPPGWAQNTWDFFAQFPSALTKP